MTTLQPPVRRSAMEIEWLEADGLGGFAMGTASGIRTRRYHGILLAATTPPTGRFMLVNGLEAWVETPKETFALSSHQYGSDVIHPDGVRRITGFRHEPWPTWQFELPDGTRIEQELFVVHGRSLAVVRYRLLEKAAGVRLLVRPLLSGRDVHATHHENPSFRFDTERQGPRLLWRPYQGVPAVAALSSGEFTAAPDWYRNFCYAEERSRGLDSSEDLASPGVFRFDLAEGEAVLLFGTGADALPAGTSTRAIGRSLRAAELRRRQRYAAPLERAEDAYLVKRGDGLTVIAGYPWFTDWGRDTFISLRGLCLATGRILEARAILLSWAPHVSEGMLPNYFPERGAAPEYNAVDSSLWFVVAVHELLALDRAIPARDRTALLDACEAILTGYARGTRHRIHLEEDGLLFAGEPGIQLTWMDARIGDWVVTPRIGKPVEVQALWLNALALHGGKRKPWRGHLEQGLAAFPRRFWNAERRCLFDVVDPDGRNGTTDPTVRPNQILAVGGLPLLLLDDERAQAVVDVVERDLLTPLGLRSLAPGEPGYCPRYEGGPRERDGAYHQGTVWPWLMGPFVEAWVRVRGGSARVRAQARELFLDPLLSRPDASGLGHIPEITDAEAPHRERGCPFQAWSVAEALRLDRLVLPATAGGTQPRKKDSLRARAPERPAPGDA